MILVGSHIVYIMHTVCGGVYDLKKKDNKHTNLNANRNEKKNKCGNTNKNQNTKKRLMNDRRDISKHNRKINGHHLMYSCMAYSIQLKAFIADITSRARIRVFTLYNRLQTIFLYVGMLTSSPQQAA